MPWFVFRTILEHCSGFSIWSSWVTTIVDRNLKDEDDAVKEKGRAQWDDTGIQHLKIILFDKLNPNKSLIADSEITLWNLNSDGQFRDWSIIRAWAAKHNLAAVVAFVIGACSFHVSCTRCSIARHEDKQNSVPVTLALLDLVLLAFPGDWGLIYICQMHSVQVNVKSQAVPLINSEEVHNAFQVGTNMVTVWPCGHGPPGSTRG